MTRNHSIVDDTEALIACPRGEYVAVSKREWPLKSFLCLAMLLSACGLPPEEEPHDAGTSSQQVSHEKNPLKVTWGMTTQEVLDVGGTPDDVNPTAPGTDPVYGDTIWHWTLACGDWYVTFAGGVVTARFGLGGTSQPLQPDGRRGCYPE